MYYPTIPQLPTELSLLFPGLCLPTVRLKTSTHHRQFQRVYQRSANAQPPRSAINLSTSVSTSLHDCLSVPKRTRTHSSYRHCDSPSTSHINFSPTSPALTSSSSQRHQSVTVTTPIVEPRLGKRTDHTSQPDNGFFGLTSKRPFNVDLRKPFTIWRFHRPSLPRSTHQAECPLRRTRLLSTMVSGTLTRSPNLTLPQSTTTWIPSPRT